MILVTSDWHADALTAGVERFDDVRMHVERMVQVAIENEVDAFIFLGDLCNADTPRAWRALRLAVDVTTWLRERDIRSYWLTGNHDVIEDGHGSSTLLPLRGIATVFDNPCVGAFVVDDESRQFLALPFVPFSHAYDPVAFINDVEGPLDLVLSHLHIAGITPGTESDEYARGRSVLLPHRLIQKKWPDATILSGHYHEPQTFEGVEVVGSVERLTKNDVDGARSYMLLDWDHGKTQKK